VRCCKEIATDACEGAISGGTARVIELPRAVLACEG
jgi:hypothetical protein